jgi:hypothetical protein
MQNLVVLYCACFVQLKENWVSVPWQTKNDCCLVSLVIVSSENIQWDNYLMSLTSVQSDTRMPFCFASDILIKKFVNCLLVIYGCILYII